MSRDDGDPVPGNPFSRAGRRHYTLALSLTFPERKKLMSLHHSPLPPADHSHSRALNQLVACVYIALRCPQCGEIRQALANAPSSDYVECPECDAECPFILLGSGLTTSQLPFHELILREQLYWHVRHAEIVDCS
jgi:hypothetical protein